MTARSLAEPCTIVIFGATGDLTHRKLIPALYNLMVDGELPSAVNVIGFARRDYTDEFFREGLEKLNQEVSRSGHDPEIWKTFRSLITYHRSEFENADGYLKLAQKIKKIENESGTQNRLFYLSTAPEYFIPVLNYLKKAGLNKPQPEGWTRVIIEKPVGTDGKSAANLNQAINESFHEQSTYRIDHYLGKETAQNLLVFKICQYHL